MYDLIHTNKHATKRDIYYTNPDLYQNQKNVDDIVDDISCLFKIERRKTHIIASPKGMVYGDLKLMENGKNVDCSKFSFGKHISPFELSSFKTNCKFILVVEKYTCFMRLIQDKFCEKNDCILVTGKGYPDLSTRDFLYQIDVELKLPCYVLVDYDPYGIEIMMTYKYGSKSFDFQNDKLRISNLKWIGLKEKDFEEYNIKNECFQCLSQDDFLKINQLKSNQHVDEEILKELNLMKKNGKKAEIESLSSKSIDFLSEKLSLKVFQ
eukprot:gene5192-8798_t